MRPSVTFSIGMAGCLLFALLLKIAGGAIPDRVPTVLADERSEPQPPVTPVIEHRIVRQIQPERFAAPFAEQASGLERIAPRQPEPEEKRVMVFLLPRPVSSEVGLFESAGQRVRLRGLKPLASSATCENGSGTEWPCGKVALARQRAFVRNRTIACANPPDQSSGTVVTSCRVINADIGEWLARNGWAEAEEGSHLQGLTEEARLSGKGLWGGDPRPLPAVP
jgi:Micrococcal nuclease (thermonuclease) homologs